MQTIARDINRGGYDLVIAHADQYTQGPLVLKYLKSPSIYYCQDVLRHHYDPKIARPYATLTGVRAVVDRLNILRILYHQTVASMDRSSLKSATMILVNSRFSMETTYRIYGVRPYVCYLGVDTQLFNPDNQLRESNRASYVISVGSIAPPKGFDFIIQALGQIPEHQRPHLLLVGNYVSEEESLYLQGLSDRLGVTLEFRPLVSDAELVQLYRRAQCTVYAPVLEPFGFVPLESMACGTPVVGVAEGGVRETIRHGETGLLVERDPKSFGDALGGFLQDPERLRAMGEKGTTHVKEAWNWDKTVTRLEDLMQQALAMGKEKA
jgi:glycosyltransferase involved in cell wall biosynthesis